MEDLNKKNNSTSASDNSDELMTNIKKFSEFTFNLSEDKKEKECIEEKERVDFSGLPKKVKAKEKEELKKDVEEEETEDEGKKKEKEEEKSKKEKPVKESVIIKRFSDFCSNSVVESVNEDENDEIVNEDHLVSREDQIAFICKHNKEYKKSDLTFKPKKEIAKLYKECEKKLAKKVNEDHCETKEEKIAYICGKDKECKKADLEKMDDKAIDKLYKDCEKGKCEKEEPKKVVKESRIVSFEEFKNRK